jgi:hypothetical protein
MLRAALDPRRVLRLQNVATAADINENSRKSQRGYVYLRMEEETVG